MDSNIVVQYITCLVQNAIVLSSVDIVTPLNSKEICVVHTERWQYTFVVFNAVIRPLYDMCIAGWNYAKYTRRYTNGNVGFEYSSFDWRKNKTLDISKDIGSKDYSLHMGIQVAFWIGQYDTCIPYFESFETFERTILSLQTVRIVVIWYIVDIEKG